MNSVTTESHIKGGVKQRLQINKALVAN